MRILFVDESEGFLKEKRDHFVLLGTIVEFEDAFELESKISEFRQKFLEGKNLKFLREYHSLAEDKKFELSKSLYELLDNHTIKLIASILGYVSVRSPNIESYVNALDFLIERYFFELFEKNDKGIIVLDRLDIGQENKIRKKFQEIIDTGEKREGKYKDRIFQIISFGDDKHSNVLQLTDLFCTGLHRAVSEYLKNNPDHSLKGNEDELVNYNRFLPLYWNLFRKYKGKVSGGGIKFWT